MDSALRAIDARWINHPDDNRRAQDKPSAMRMASASGLTVPKWIVTSSPRTAVDFADACSNGIVVKALHAGRIDETRSLFTTRIDDPAVLATVGPEPYLVQAFVRKSYDVRATVVGDSVHAVAIESQDDPAGKVDWRRGDASQMRHRPVELPTAVRQSLIRLCKAYNLRYGAADFAVDDRAVHHFLEINPNGEWGWVERMSGIPLADLLAQELAR